MTPRNSKSGAAIVFSLIPKIPFTLLFFVGWIWIESFTLFQGAIDTARVRVESPVFPLESGVAGTWIPDWSSWPTWKSAPVLFATGLPRTSEGNSHPAVMRVRCSPQDAISKDQRSRLDAEGWFEVGLESEWQSHARLNAGELRSVEYRVLRTDPGSSARGSLVIKGYLDDTDIEFALHYRLLWKVGSSIALVALCIWFGLGFRRRLKARRADI